MSEDERGTWGSRGTPRRLQASAEAGGGRRVAAGAGHALRVLLARGGRRLAEPVGWAEPGGWASTGKARVGFPLSLSLFLFVSVFLINCNCWALNKILKRFQKS